MRNYCLLIAFCLISISQMWAAKTTVNGTILSPKADVVSIQYYSDFFDLKTETFYARLDDANSFSFEFEFNEPKYVELLYDEHHFKLFVEPSDEINIYLDASRTEESALAFSGDGAEQNNYLSNARRKFSNTNDVYMRRLARELEPVKFVEILDTLRAKRIRYFNDAFLDNDYSFEFSAFALAEIEYWYGYQLLNYRYSRADKLEQSNPVYLPDSILTQFDKLILDNSAAWESLYYQYFLDLWVSYKTESLPITRDQVNLIKNTFTEKRETQLLAKHLIKLARQSKSAYVSDEYSSFLSKHSGTKYADKVLEVYKQVGTAKAGRRAPDFALPNRKKELQRLSRFLGKVVYIDFWATWCIPCVKEINNSGALRARYKDNPDVVFFYVSLDRNQEEWKAFLKRKHIDGIHVFANGVFESEIAKLYNVDVLPRYILIDKNGNLIKSNAKKPTDPMLMNDIEKLLQQ